MRNTERKILVAKAIMSEQNYGTSPNTAVCSCCGKVMINPIFKHTPTQPNGQYLEKDHLFSYTATAEKWGSDSENGENCIVKFTVDINDIDTLFYVAIKNVKAGKVLTAKKSGVMVRFKSVKITSYQSANKFFSGLVAYGCDRKVTVVFDKGLIVTTRVENTADVFKIASRYLQTSGKPKQKWLAKLEEIATIQ